MKDLRPAIIRAHNRGKKQNEIADFLGISQGTGRYQKFFLENAVFMPKMLRKSRFLAKNVEF